jgi:hypothetical protein
MSRSYTYACESEACWQDEWVSESTVVRRSREGYIARREESDPVKVFGMTSNYHFFKDSSYFCGGNLKC